jgi:hypothetical protein
VTHAPWDASVLIGSTVVPSRKLKSWAPHMIGTICAFQRMKFSRVSFSEIGWPRLGVDDEIDMARWCSLGFDTILDLV